MRFLKFQYFMHLLLISIIIPLSCMVYLSDFTGKSMLSSLAANNFVGAEEARVSILNISSKFYTVYHNGKEYKTEYIFDEENDTCTVLVDKFSHRVIATKMPVYVDGCYYTEYRSSKVNSSGLVVTLSQYISNLGQVNKEGLNFDMTVYKNNILKVLFLLIILNFLSLVMLKG